MGVEACLVILAALSSSGAEEGYLTRVCRCEGGRSVVQSQCRTQEHDRPRCVAAGFLRTQKTGEAGGEGQV